MSRIVLIAGELLNPIIQRRVAKCPFAPSKLRRNCSPRYAIEDARYSGNRILANRPSRVDPPFDTTALRAAYSGQMGFLSSEYPE